MSYDLINPRRVVTEGVAEIEMQPLSALVGELRGPEGPAQPLTPEAEVVLEAEAILAAPNPTMEIHYYGAAHDHACWSVNNSGWGAVLDLLDACNAIPQGAYDYGDNSGWQVTKEESAAMAAAVRAALAEPELTELFPGDWWTQHLEDLAAFLEQAARDDGFEVW